MYHLNVLISLILIFSCREKQKNTQCLYTRDAISKAFDTSLLEKRNYSKDSLFEVLDIGADGGTRGIYKFDEKNRLGFYAFLLSDSNNYNFSRTYDTLGNI
jgi:hypothetical protein